MRNRAPASTPAVSGPSGHVAIGVDGVLPDDGPSADASRYLRMLRRRWPLGVAVMVCFALLVLVLTMVQPRSYTTSIRFLAGSANAETSPAVQGGAALPILSVLAEMNNGAQTAETYAALMTQAGVAEKVIAQTGVKMTPGELLKRVTVTPLTDTAMLQLSVSARDPNTSAMLANAYGTVFVDYERDLITHSAENAVQVLQKQLPDAQDRLDAAQEALRAYQQRSGIADLTSQTTDLVTVLSGLNTKLREAQQTQQAGQSSLAQVNQEIAQTPATVVGQKSISTNPVASNLEEKVAELQQNLAALRQQYTDNYPSVIAAKAALAEAQRALREQPHDVISGTENVANPLYQALEQQKTNIEEQVAAATTQIGVIQQQIAQVKPSLDKLPEQSRRISQLQSDQKSAQDVYDALRAKLQDATITRNTAPSDLTVTSAAEANNFTVSPNLGFNLPVGVFIGAILGLAAIFIAEYFDDRFRSEADVKERLGLPVLAAIPQMGDVAEKADPYVKPMSLEAFYQLVAALRFSSSNPPRTIAFTSPDQGDGKSTIALNTAISLSMLKARVLLVDADLRRPSLHEKLAVHNDRGLSDVLVGLAKFPDAVQTTAHAGVWILPSGRPAPNPVGLLQSAAFDRFLRRARERFDFIVIDGPALRSIIDGVILGLKADGTVLVVSAERSRGRAVDGALQKLRSVGTINLLGVVLNGLNVDKREHSEYYLGAGQSISLPSNSNA